MCCKGGRAGVLFPRQHETPPDTEPMKKELFQIQVTSNGKPIGKISCEQFRASIGAPRNAFLQECVQKFNDWKKRIGEPERAEISINA
jgi:hypothetical protein